VYPTVPDSIYLSGWEHPKRRRRELVLYNDTISSPIYASFSSSPLSLCVFCVLSLARSGSLSFVYLFLFVFLLYGGEKMVAPALLPELWTEILVPICAVIGIAFSLFQWYVVSRVKLTSDLGASSSGGANNGKNGYGDYLIEEEEGVNDQSVVAKCAEIQTAISEGKIY